MSDAYLGGAKIMDWGTMKDRVLFAYEEDIKRMGAGWQFYHIFKKPPHKHEGHVILGIGALKLKGDDGSGGNIPYGKIKGLHLGFGKIFKRRMSIFRPLRIRYQTDGREDTVYLFVGFHKAIYFTSFKMWTIPKTKNGIWFDALKEKSGVRDKVGGERPWRREDRVDKRTRGRGGVPYLDNPRARRGLVPGITTRPPRPATAWEI